MRQNTWTAMFVAKLPKPTVYHWNRESVIIGVNIEPEFSVSVLNWVEMIVILGKQMLSDVWKSLAAATDRFSKNIPYVEIEN